MKKQNTQLFYKPTPILTIGGIIYISTDIIMYFIRLNKNKIKKEL